MSDKHETVSIFPSHVEAEAAVLELQRVGFDMRKISIIGKDYQTTEHVRGFFTWKDTAFCPASTHPLRLDKPRFYPR